jgi:hypothetical protein
MEHCQRASPAASRGTGVVGRRQFLISAAAAGKLAAAKTPTVAAVITEYRSLSHADVIAGRILEGYSPDGVKVAPRTRIVSMYTDQVPQNDMSRGLAAKHGFRIYPTVREALTLGGPRLAVDAVLLVGEHGNYPTNSRGQKMYPRYELFRQIVDVIRESGRRVPLFSDKHLSYSWENASRMYRWARELRLPFMAGSSIPVTARKPELEIPLGSRLRRAVSVGYGELDAYGFHTLEGLQCMVERRRGGETGIAAAEWLEGDAVWKWRDGEGRWSAPLLEAALATGGRVKPGRPEQNVKRPALFLLEYKDGLRTASYMLEGHVSEFEFAAELEGRPEPVAAQYVLAGVSRPLPHFDGLVKCIEDLFVTGRPVYPVERTLLTTGALAFLFESRERRSRVATPELNVSYKPPAHTWFERG